MGPSDRMKEEEQLAKLLTPLGLGMRDIKVGHRWRRWWCRVEAWITGGKRGTGSRVEEEADRAVAGRRAMARGGRGGERGMQGLPAQG